MSTATRVGRTVAAAGLAALGFAACGDATDTAKVATPSSAAPAAHARLLPGGTGTVASARFVRLEATSEINGNPWTSVAELNVLDAKGAVIPRTGWAVTADSEEVAGEDSAAIHAIDGDPYSFWHSRWKGGSLPHLLVVDMGSSHSVGGFKYLPRQVGPNGRIADWRFATSLNGTNWTLAAEGSFPDGKAEVTVRFPVAGSASAAALPVAKPDAVRAARIAALARGPLVAGTVWRAGEPVAIDMVRRIASGQHLVYTTAGTTGSREPALPVSGLEGRPIADGSATAYANGRVLKTTRDGAPGIEGAVNASSAGLIETDFAAGDFNPPRFAAVQGCRSLSTGTSFIGHYCFANGPAAGGSGNATAIASGPNGAKLSADYVYHANTWEEEFVVTDRRFGLVFANSQSPIDVEIDGVQVEAGPTVSSGGEGWTLVFDYHGAAARRTVRVVSAVGSVAPTLRGVALTGEGRVEAGTRSTDQLLVLGDSINATVTPPSEAGAQMPSYWLQRDLGFGGVINMAVGGSGYVSQNPGSFNLPNLLTNPVNRSLLAGYAPSISHVLVGAGFNDRSRPLSEVRAAALASWRALRELLPKAKNSITDGWSGSSGPDANALALAAGLASSFEAWGDANSRLIRSVGASAATAYISGAGNAGLPPAPGNSSFYTSTDAVHPTPAGGRYLARRLADDIVAAWPTGY